MCGAFEFPVEDCAPGVAEGFGVLALGFGVWVLGLGVGELGFCSVDSSTPEKRIELNPLWFVCEGALPSVLSEGFPPLD